MLEITCTGTPYEIGHQHGTLASPLITNTITFYSTNFLKTAKLTWPSTLALASKFLPFLQGKFPEYVEEMGGVAEGSGRELLEIVAVNVRTEIMFASSFGDGCTALSWRVEGEGKGKSWLAQNWDWEEEQKGNLVLLRIAGRGEGRPEVVMVTEAGLIGKIGFNDAGVGVCLNAIRAPGLDYGKCPTHIALRVVLDSRSREEAVGKLEEVGVASACHIFVADGKTGGVGLEWSAFGVRKCEMDARGRVFHANHYLKQHDCSTDGGFFRDSPFRTERIEKLADELKTDAPSWEQIEGIFKDEENLPGAICRATGNHSTTATLFNIVMELAEKQAVVKIGRPVAPEETLTLKF